MHFEIAHEFDIPLDALELAVVSPDLCEKLSGGISNVEAITQKSYELEGTELHRVWNFQGKVSIPKFARPYITKEMIAWDEETAYDLKKHGSSWKIAPNVKPEWQQYFTGAGTYTLVSLDAGRTKRIVEGDVTLRVKLVKNVAEKLIVSELRKVFDAEATRLREIGQLT